MSTLKEIDTKTVTNELLEKILSSDNMNLAFKRVKANKGASGIDDMTVDELLQYLKENGVQIKEDIRNGKYNPKAVRRVEIPKADGSKRKLGIPTVVDRVIQQAVAQQLNKIYEPIFSENSYGFRLNKSCHDAIMKAKKIVVAALSLGLAISMVACNKKQTTPVNDNTNNTPTIHIITI